MLSVSCLYFLLLQDGRTQGEAEDIACKIESITSVGDSILVRVKLRNLSKDTVLFFKPELDNVNYGLISFKLLDVAGNKLCEYDYGKSGEIDNIKATPENCDVLMPQGHCDYSFSLGKNLFRCYKGSIKKPYQFEFSIHYSPSIFSYTGARYKIFLGSLKSTVANNWSK